MKWYLLLSSVFYMLLSCNFTQAQGYFVSGAGKYVNEKSFKTNSQNKLSNYEGNYEAVSETYESNYIFEITTKNEKLNIKAILGHTEDGGENWYSDTIIFDDVTVENGKFRIDVNGNNNFRFVKAIYKSEESNKNISSIGFVMEEYKMYAEKIVSGSGNGSKDNINDFTIDKKLNFGVGIDEFKKDFPEIHKKAIKSSIPFNILGKEIDFNITAAELQKLYSDISYQKDENFDKVSYYSIERKSESDFFFLRITFVYFSDKLCRIDIQNNSSEQIGEEINQLVKTFKKVNKVPNIIDSNYVDDPTTIYKKNRLRIELTEMHFTFCSITNEIVEDDFRNLYPAYFN